MSAYLFFFLTLFYFYFYSNIFVLLKYSLGQSIFPPLPSSTSQLQSYFDLEQSRLVPTMTSTSKVISDLLALNQVNLKSWSCISKYILAPQLQPSPSTNTIINVPQVARVICKGTRTSPASLSFQPGTLELELQSLASCFPKAINLFNDQLPTTSYFDLSPVIDKLKMLDQSAAGRIIGMWKKALEDVREKLGSLENQILTVFKTEEKVKELFNIKILYDPPEPNPYPDFLPDMLPRGKTFYLYPRLSSVDEDYMKCELKKFGGRRFTTEGMSAEQVRQRWVSLANSMNYRGKNGFVVNFEVSLLNPKMFRTLEYLVKALLCCYVMEPCARPNASSYHDTP